MKDRGKTVCSNSGNVTSLKAQKTKSGTICSTSKDHRGDERKDECHCLALSLAACSADEGVVVVVVYVHIKDDTT